MKWELWDPWAPEGGNDATGIRESGPWDEFEAPSLGFPHPWTTILPAEYQTWTGDRDHQPSAFILREGNRSKKRKGLGQGYRGKTVEQLELEFEYPPSQSKKEPEA